MQLEALMREEAVVRRDERLRHGCFMATILGGWGSVVLALPHAVGTAAIGTESPDVF
jgi:hypothetical protein